MAQAQFGGAGSRIADDLPTGTALWAPCASQHVFAPDWQDRKPKEQERKGDFLPRPFPKKLEQHLPAPRPPPATLATQLQSTRALLRDRRARPGPPDRGGWRAAARGPLHAPGCLALCPSPWLLCPFPVAAWPPCPLPVAAWAPGTDRNPCPWESRVSALRPHRRGLRRQRWGAVWWVQRWGAAACPERGPAGPSDVQWQEEPAQPVPRSEGGFLGPRWAVLPAGPACRPGPSARLGVETRAGSWPWTEGPSVCVVSTRRLRWDQGHEGALRRHRLHTTCVTHEDVTLSEDKRVDHLQAGPRVAELRQGGGWRGPGSGGRGRIRSAREEVCVAV